MTPKKCEICGAPFVCVTEGEEHKYKGPLPVRAPRDRTCASACDVLFAEVRVAKGMDVSKMTTRQRRAADPEGYLAEMRKFMARRAVRLASIPAFEAALDNANSTIRILRAQLEARDKELAKLQALFNQLHGVDA